MRSRSPRTSARSPPSTAAASPRRSCRSPSGRSGRRPAAARRRTLEVIVDRDEGPRRDTSLQALAKLAPAFHAAGTVTAGNSSQTSDGASALLLVSGQYARDHELMPLARFVAYATAGVPPELFGIGPVPAVQKVLKQAGLTLADIDLVELNEAFAAQVLACLAELDIPPDWLNVNGGAIALGHPLGCTGARMTTSLVHELGRRGGALRPGDDVCGRGDGRGGDIRADCERARCDLLSG